MITIKNTRGEFNLTMSDNTQWKGILVGTYTDNWNVKQLTKIDDNGDIVDVSDSLECFDLSTSDIHIAKNCVFALANGTLSKDSFWISEEDIEKAFNKVK